MLKVDAAMFADDLCREVLAMDSFMELSPGWRSFLGLKRKQESLLRVL